MTIKDILVMIESAERSTPAADFALSLAEFCGAKLTAVGLILEIPDSPSPSYLTTYLGDFPPSWAATATKQRSDAVDAAFMQFQKAAVSPQEIEFLRLKALPDDARQKFARLASHFDLTVIAQGQKGYNSDEEMMTEAALFRSGRPVFVVPYIQKGRTAFKRAIVAWDGGHAAARAVADALPLLAQAESVQVVSITNKDNGIDLPGFNITRHLARHGIQAELHSVPQTIDPGSQLLSLAADQAADYLVMGAYGHSRLREFILGGATRTILESMTLPVLMSH